MKDINWLLSACSQSAAAIIAIIGGFIISNVLRVSSEKNSILNSTKDINSQLNSVTKLIEEKNSIIIDCECKMFVNRILEKLISTASEYYYKNGSFEGLNFDFNTDLDSFSYTENIESLKSEYHNVIKHIYTTILALTDKKTFKDFPKNSKTFINNYEPENTPNLHTDIKQIHEETFKVYNRINTTGTSKKPGLGNFLKGFSENIDIDVITLHTKTKESLSEQLVYKTSLSLKKQLNDEKLDALTKPSGLFGGLIVFLYFSIVGIIVPLLYIPIDPAIYNNSIKFWIISLFISGLIAVFLYIVLLVINTFKPNK